MRLTSALLASVLALATAHAADDAGKLCLKIRQACEAAGYKKGGHKEGKGLVVDCMKKLAAGGAVEGVSVAAEDVAACREKRAERKEKMEKRRERREENRAAGRAVHGAKKSGDAK